MAITTTDAQKLYISYFGRPADTAGLTFWANPGSANTMQMQSNNFANSSEWKTAVNGMTTTQIVNLIYINSFGHAPDPDGLNFWVTAITIGTISVGDAAWKIVTNTGPADTAILAAKVTAVQGYTAAVTASTTDNVAYGNSAAFASANTWLDGITTAAQADAALIPATLDASLAAMVTASNGSAAPFTLTTGVDAPGTGAFATASPSGNVTTYGSFNSSTTTTLTAGDTIRATGLNNILNLADGGTGSTALLNTAATVSGVQTLVINSGEAVSLNAVTGLGGLVGLTQLTATTASSSNTTSNVTVFTAAATTNVTVTDAAVQLAGAAAGGVTVNGGLNVSVTETGATTTASAIVIGGSTATNPTGTVNVTVTGAGNTTVSANGGTTQTVTTSQSGAVSLGQVTAASGAVTVTNTNGVTGGGAITIYGGASASVTETAAVSATAGVKGITNAVSIAGVTGIVGVTQTAVTGKAILVSGGTAVTINTTGNVGAGAVDVGTVTTTTAVPSGAIIVTNTNSYTSSSDAITIGTLANSTIAGAVTVTTTASSGAITVGIDTAAKGAVGNVIITNQTNYSNGTTIYGAGGAESVYVNGATAVTLSGGTTNVVKDKATTQALASLSVTGATGVTTATGNALTTLTLNKAISGSTLQVTNSTVGHTATVNISGNTGVTGGPSYTGPVFVDDVAATINVVATGAANTISVTDALVGKVNLSFTNNGTGTLTLGTLSLGGFTGSTSTFTLAGTGAIDVGSAFSTAYNANSYATLTQNGTGAVTAAVTIAQNFVGGTSTGSVITIGSTGATVIAGSIVGGSGGNNTAIFLGNPYSVANGGAYSGFQNLEVKGGSVNGSWAANGLSNVLTSGLTQTAVTPATVGNSVTFTNLAATTGLKVLAQAVTAGTAATFGLGVNAASLYSVDISAYSATTTYSLTVNGVTHTTLGTGGTVATTATALAGSFTAAELKGATVVVDGTTTSQIDVVNATSVSQSATGSTGTVTVTNALSGVITENLSTAAAAALGNTLNLSVGSASNIGTTTAVIAESNNQTIAIDSVLGKAAAATVANGVIINDVTGTAVANQATTLTLSGAGNIVVSYANIGTSTNALATINAGTSSGAVNVTAVAGKTTGLTITGGSGLLTAAGSGTVTGQSPASYYGATDSITSGSGGATVNLGYAGFGVNTGSGTQTINLAASLIAKDTINALSVGGAHAIVQSFKDINTTKADVLNLNAGANARILTNVPTATVLPSGTGTGSNTYTVSNGIITFIGTDLGTTLLADAQAIVNATAYAVAAYSDGSNTYVVYNSINGAGAIATDTVVTLSGVTGVTGFGTTGTSNTINLSTALAGTAGTTSNAQGFATIDNATTALTQNDAGYFEQYLGGVTAAAKVYNNLGAYAIIDSASTGSAAGYTISTTQTGAAGTNYLTFNATGAGQTIAALNLTGDWGATINTGTALTVTSLVDSGNTLSALTISGAGATNILAITDTALTSINISAGTGVVHLGASTAGLSQAGLTVTSLTTGATANLIYLSGAGDTINLSAVTAGSGTAVYSATGTGSTILGGIGATSEVFTVGANGTVTMLQGVAASVGVSAVNGDSGNANAIAVGTNSTVNLGTNSTGVSSDGGSIITVAGNTTGLVTINHAADGVTQAVFFTAHAATQTATFVNVASAATLAAAQALAVTVATNGATTTTDTYAAFNWTDGNTYIIGHHGAAETTVGASDVIVELTGVFNNTITVSAGGVVTL